MSVSGIDSLQEISGGSLAAHISLDKPIPPKCPVAEILPIADFLAGRKINIGDPVPDSNGYNELYYIGRTFRIQKVINQGIYSKKEVKEKQVFLASTEAEFKQLSQLYPKNNVHWLQKQNSGKLVWQQSRGSLETVRRCIDTESSHTYTADDLDTLIEQAQHQKVILISDTAGMGKSTVLTHLSKVIKQKIPSNWVVRIDLNDHTDVLKILKNEQINSKEAIEFVSEKLLKLKAGLEMEIFKQCCEQKQKVRIVIMLDGFDEISPYYKQSVIRLLEALRQTAVEQLWVTTRPHLKKELEDTLQQLSYTLEPFSERGQVEFLTNFWKIKDWFTEPEEKTKETEKNKLEIYAKHLIKKLANSISDKDKEFTGIPLQTRMLAEAFDGEVKIFCLSSEPMPDLPLKLDLLELYGRFIEKKYDIYQEEKFKINVNMVAAMEQRERDLKIMKQDHQLLATEVLFTEEQVALFQNNNQRTFSVEELTRFGLVQLSHEGKPHFIHRTFAEYYVARIFVKNTSQKVQDLILKDIFLKEEYQVIRVFIDGLLSRSKPSKEMSIQYGTRINDLGNDCLLHTAALEGNANIITFILESARAGGHTDKVIRLLLGEDRYERTAWLLAAVSGELEVLEIITLWAKEHLTRGDRKRFLLTENVKENADWYRAAHTGKQEVMQKILDFAKENLTASEIKHKMFLAKNLRGNTAWYLAVNGANQDVQQKIFDFAKDNLTEKEITKMLFLIIDKCGKTARDLAAKKCNQDLLQKIWDLAKDTLTADEIKYMLFIVKDIDENTAWHLAAKWRNHDLLKKIWNFAKENLTADEIKNRLFLTTDRHGNTAWHLAAKWRNQDLLQKIWDFAKDNLTADEIKSMLFLTIERYENTAWHLAAKWHNQYLLQKMLDFAKDNRTAYEQKNMLFSAMDRKRNTIWHYAPKWHNQDLLQKIWDFAKDNLTTEEIKNKFFLAPDSDGNTAWHLAAKWCNRDLLQKIWDCAKDNLTAEEIKKYI